MRQVRLVHAFVVQELIPVNDSFYETHIFSSTDSDPTSAWSQIATVTGCQYDSGAMLDDDGMVYVSYKNQTDNTFQ